MPGGDHTLSMEKTRPPGGNHAQRQDQAPGNHAQRQDPAESYPEATQDPAESCPEAREDPGQSDPTEMSGPIRPRGWSSHTNRAGGAPYSTLMVHCEIGSLV